MSAIVVAATNTSDNWDDGQLHGWLGNTAATVVSVPAAGGNPGGYLLSASAVTGNPYRTIGAMNHEDRYTGDLAAAGVHRVSVDLNLLSGQSTWVRLRMRYRDFSHNGWVYQLDGSMPVSQWRHYEVNFDPNWTDAQAIAAGWVQESTSASFRDTMADVYSMEVRLLMPVAAVPNTQLGIDNFYLYATGSNGTATAVPVLSLPVLVLLVGGIVFLGYRRLAR
ncbi:hypothetical protein [Thiolapillus brandeum]|nr:hypothetical protein [Thiolapillus brandeum]